MGLSIIVGALADDIANGEWGPEELSEIRSEYEALSKLLSDRGLGSHVEPEELEDWPYRGQTVGFPYSSIHHLRRARAYQRAGLQLLPADNDAVEDPVLQAEYQRPLSNSHLINHADDQGFYVPKDFPWPICGEYEGQVVGDVVGSSNVLLRELVELAPLIGLNLKDDLLDDETAKILAEEDDHPFATERMVWFALYEAAKQSIAQNSVITFS